MQKNIILFDINETVLDLSSLKPAFNQLFQGKETLDQWFANLLHSSTITLLTQLDTNFSQLAQINLSKLMMKHNIELDQEKQIGFLGKFALLQPHIDIIPALKLLRQNDFQTIAFSNSSTELLTKQISNAGLLAYFDDLISVEGTGSFKPDKKVYHYVANKLEVPIETLTLVAVHDWDTHGALCAGMQAAFLARGPVLYSPLFKEPTIQGTSMIDIAETLISLSSNRGERD